MSEINFCCTQLEAAINDPDIPLIFIPKFREFGIRILDGGTSILKIDFCPWSGHKLPRSLRDEWFDSLEQLGIDPCSKEVPVEYTDDRWYGSTLQASR